MGQRPVPPGPAGRVRVSDTDGSTVSGTVGLTVSDTGSAGAAAEAAAVRASIDAALETLHGLDDHGGVGKLVGSTHARRPVARRRAHGGAAVRGPRRPRRRGRRRGAVDAGRRPRPLRPARRPCARCRGHCVVRRPKLGLRLEFLSLGIGAPCRQRCPRRRRDHAPPRWRTVARAARRRPRRPDRRLYPRTRRGTTASGSCRDPRACKEVGGFPFPGLLAVVGAGRVTALVVRTVPCE